MSNPFPRPCERCGKKFQPTGRFNKYCEECISKVMKRRKSSSLI